jgi:DNA-binding MarR family transcriptional regulator
MLWKDYRDLFRHLTERLEAQLARDAGLSASEYAVLVELSHVPNQVLRARELCAALSWDRSRLSHLVGRMEKRGLVARAGCADDARGSMVRLTDAGRTAVDDAAPEHSEAIRRYFFNPLSAEELETLGVVFTRLLDNLEDQRD